MNNLETGVADNETWSKLNGAIHRKIGKTK